MSGMPDKNFNPPPPDVIASLCENFKVPHPRKKTQPPPPLDIIIPSMKKSSIQPDKKYFNPSEKNPNLFLAEKSRSPRHP